MYRHHHWLEDSSEEKIADRQTASLAGVAVILLLLVGGLFLVQQLRTATLIQDCIIAGRLNCDASVTAQH